MVSVISPLMPGSSPRVRGTVQLCVRCQPGERFIPACAGNSSANPVRSKQRTVHPRVCGEQASGVSPNLAQTGSSPRVRGTGIRRLAQFGPNRFIPACAGNRHQASRPIWPKPVHPRVCGEQTLDWMLVDGDCGSSPRVRGTDRPGRTEYHENRFIPACAGNRNRLEGMAKCGAVHPRVCGEQSFHLVIGTK